MIPRRAERRVSESSASVSLAAEKRARAKALRLITDVASFQDNGTSMPEYPAKAVADLKNQDVKVFTSDYIPGAGHQAFLHDPFGNFIELNQPDHMHGVSAMVVLQAGVGHYNQLTPGLVNQF